MKSNYEISIYGKVQGVGFRYFAHKTALEHHISGYVKNIGSRTVLVIAEGETDDLETFTDYLRIGPAMAQIEKITVSKSPFTGGFISFEVRH